MLGVSHHPFQNAVQVSRLTAGWDLSNHRSKQESESKEQFFLGAAIQGNGGMSQVRHSGHNQLLSQGGSGWAGWHSRQQAKGSEKSSSEK